MHPSGLISLILSNIIFFPISSTSVAFKTILALLSNVIKDILSSLFIVETTVFKACLTSPNLEIPKSSPPFRSSVVDSSIEPETSIIAIKTKGFLDSFFSGSNETFTKTLLSSFGSSITSALNVFIFVLLFLSIF